ncbi:hypothetical protein ACNR9Q_12555 [Maribacter sp. X9]|uniref:hypothetical protein n=1 Tax=Maribacter sp. X9 TaxID=3402159 RepID=UPI003AF3502D
MFSQYTWTEGELLLKGGKTLVGELRIPIVSKDLIHFNGKSKVRFRNKEKGEKAAYDEEQVELMKFKYSESEIAYFKYIPVSENKKEIFCVVVSGKATLYGRTVGMTTTTPGILSFYNLNEFYVQRPDEAIASPLETVRPSKSFRKRATEYFQDCPIIVSKLSTKIFSKDDIITIVETYNTCVE